jgi:hypothetical protein
MKQSQMILMGALACIAWLALAEHPTAKNLRTAVVDTMPFL